jgi:osmotically-inducible protein OsmY
MQQLQMNQRERGHARPEHSGAAKRCDQGRERPEMPSEYPNYSHKDDDPHLTDDDLAEKVLHFLRYATAIDTSDMEVIALGNIVVLSGTVGSEADIASAGEAAASVIGVSSVENGLRAREGRS